jgi:ankyrin repeat protein
MTMISLAMGVWSLLLVPSPAVDIRLADQAMGGSLEGVRALLTERVDVNAAQGDGMTALHWAAYRDDLPMAELLIAAKAAPEAETRVGAITPLILAARNGSASMIAALLKAGADPGKSATTGGTPLMSAAASGNVDAIRTLIDAGADLNARERTNGQTALMFAAWENRGDAIRLLVSRGANPGLTSFVTVLDEPQFDDDGFPIAKKKGAQSGGSSVMGGMTALLFAARDGHLDAVKALLESGANVNQVSGGDGTSAINIAIANGHYTVGKYLLDHGADPNLANLDGLTPLYATVNMRYAPVSWAPNPRTDQESVSSTELLQALLEGGANPNARVRGKLWFSPTSHDRGWVDHKGATAFWRAAMSSDVEAMKILVAGGADPNLANDSGVTPLMVAAGIGWSGNFSQNAPDSWMAAIQYCLELGADVNAIEKRKGYTALHGAASRGDSEMVQYLVDKGAKVDVVNKDGNSPADMAFGPSRFFIPSPETVALLVKLGSPFQNNCRSDQCVDGKFLGGAVAK